MKAPSSPLAFACVVLILAGGDRGRSLAHR